MKSVIDSQGAGLAREFLKMSSASKEDSTSLFCWLGWKGEVIAYFVTVPAGAASSFCS